ncbi:hypothetical protein DL768_005744 [Monosporascus sp. mg162]|nr:hypothetical protein DL768_005744 [Monosporascus sp. mg162]
MKNPKISGLSAAVGDSVQKLRVEELASGSRFRKIGIIAALVGYILLMVSPPLTFALAQRTLDTVRIFPSLAYLLLLRNPLSQIFQPWLSLVLDLVVTVMAAVLTTLAVRLHSNSGFTGASFVTRIILETTFQAFAEDQTDSTPSLALRDMYLAINSGEKVAICGRTGSGESSLIALLLKLLDPLAETAGNAVIDNTPLHRLDRPALHQRIIAVPQEAVFLPDGSTFQANVDSFDVSTPEECQAVLAAVDLCAGQRQLMSLGRALLRRRIRIRNLGIGGGGSEDDILLSDEVSSDVDDKTERVMQEIIRAEFRAYTVVAVSRRRDITMDFDRVVVMDTGEIVEVGNLLMLTGEERD